MDRSTLRCCTLLLATGLALAGCGGGTNETTSTKHTAMSLDRPTTDSGPAHEIPNDFPLDVHLPAVAYTIGHVVRSSAFMELSLHTSQARNELYAEYEAAMKSSGWREVMSAQASPSQWVLSFNKGDRQVNVSLLDRADSDDHGTDVGLRLETRSSSP
jgi:hypothetical protein